MDWEWNLGRLPGHVQHSTDYRLQAGPAPPQQRRNVPGPGPPRPPGSPQNCTCRLTKSNVFFYNFVLPLSVLEHKRVFTWPLLHSQVRSSLVILSNIEIENIIPTSHSNSPTPDCQSWCSSFSLKSKVSNLCKENFIKLFTAVWNKNCSLLEISESLVKLKVWPTKVQVLSRPGHRAGGDGDGEHLPAGDLHPFLSHL